MLPHITAQKLWRITLYNGTKTVVYYLIKTQTPTSIFTPIYYFLTILSFRLGYY